MESEELKSAFEMPYVGGVVESARTPSRPNRIKVRLVFTHCEQVGEKTFRQNYNTAEAVIECHAPKEEVKGHLVGVEVLGYEDEEFA